MMYLQVWNWQTKYHNFPFFLYTYEMNFTLKAPITTEADDKFRDIFPNFRKKEGMILHEQSFLMKYHALFVIFEKAATYAIVFVCVFDLILYVPSTIFQLNREGSSWVEPDLS